MDQHILRRKLSSFELSSDTELELISMVSQKKQQAPDLRVIASATVPKIEAKCSTKSWCKVSSQSQPMFNRKEFLNKYVKPKERVYGTSTLRGADAETEPLFQLKDMPAVSDNNVGLPNAGDFEPPKCSSMELRAKKMN